MEKQKLDNFRGIPGDRSKFAWMAYVLENTRVHAYLGQARNSFKGDRLDHQRAIGASGSLDTGHTSARGLTAVKSTGFIVG